jgi:predicted GTPase
MFGDWYWQESRMEAQQKRYVKWLETVQGKRVVVIEIGAGDAIATVRYQAQRLRTQVAHRIIQINPNPAKYADIIIAEGALSGLTSITACFV